MRHFIREQRHRLPEEIYKGKQVVSFTANIKYRSKFFLTDDVFQPNKAFLLKEMKNCGVEAEVYLFMPDHAHFLLRGSRNNSDVLAAMNRFKQRSGYWLYKHYPEIHWQKDFYDHIVRPSEKLENHIRYILMNPVKAGLVEDWKTYPFKGSIYIT